MKKANKKVKKEISAQSEIKKLQALASTLAGKKPSLSTKLILSDFRALKEKNR